MLGRSMICGLLCLGVSWFVMGAVEGDDKHHDIPKSPTNAGLEKMKSLAGTWLAADKDGKPTEEIVSVIKVTAGGSVVHETIFPGQPHEMVSVYTVDGNDLVMTHYCMLGNQPQMKASTKSLGNRLNFEFSGGTNFDPKKDKHMHSSVVTFVDDDHYEAVGEGWENGKPMPEMCGGMKLVRKK